MQFSIKIDYFWRSKNSKRSMRVHNYFASRKSRVTNERNFSATLISFLPSSASSLLLFLSDCGYSAPRMPYRQKRNRKVEGSEQETSPPSISTYTYAQYARIQHCTRVHAFARAHVTHLHVGIKLLL